MKNFRFAIDDPNYFCGRKVLLQKTFSNPLDVWIFLGGRRIGKTSFMNALEWNLLDFNNSSPSCVFPVLMNANLRQPRSLNHLRYLLVDDLRRSFERWRKAPGVSFQDMYRYYRSQIVSGEVSISFLQQINIKLDLANPDYTCELEDENFRIALQKTIEELQQNRFNGICFLVDGAEYIARQEWAIDAWNYFRALKDTQNALKPYVGFVLSGYRELKDYQQEVGSPLLNIASIRYLSPFSEEETYNLISLRSKLEGIQLSSKVIKAIHEWAGLHPYLLQLMLDELFDGYRHEGQVSLKVVIEELLVKCKDTFASWWGESQEPDRLGEEGRDLYKIFLEQRVVTIEALSKSSGLGIGKVRNVLRILVTTGIILQIDTRKYKIGSHLFEVWVMRRLD